MSIPTTREQRRALARQNARMPCELQLVPAHDWPQHLRDGNRLRVWRSRDWLVQEFKAPTPALVRLSVNRTSLTGDRWADGVTWDELQDIKAQCGYAAADAVEVYPAAGDVVNVASMRHLWVLREPVPFKWRRDEKRTEVARALGA